ncbi:FHA domain-containing protein, partial [Mycobacterium simulans]|uniref:FHA domain-containing protein n=1 Tax=Mycobacterium simulans TaxID=627089 RepID=UPI00174E933D
MPPPAPPALTVRYDGSERTFAAGHDVVVGRDLRADMRVTHPLISRAHLLLRFDQGRWLAIDNNSLNGTYANGRRVPVVEIYDGQNINIGNPDGPLLRFEVGRHVGMAGRPPQTNSMPIVATQAGWHPAQPAPPPSGHHPTWAPPAPTRTSPPPPPPAPP